MRLDLCEAQSQCWHLRPSLLEARCLPILTSGPVISSVCIDTHGWHTLLGSLQAGQGKLVQLQHAVGQRAVSTGTADAQACNKTGTTASSSEAAGAPEQDHAAMREAAEPRECQQCNEFAQQLEDCIREYEGGQAEVRQLSQQLAAVQQGRECAQCLSLAQQLEACMQAAEARVLHISQQVFARGEAAQRAHCALEAVTEQRDALAASLAEHMAALSQQAASLMSLQALVSQRDAAVLELQDALSAYQRGPGDLSRHVEPSCAGMTDHQQGRAWVNAGQAESQQPPDRQAGADMAGVQSHVGKLHMELAALTADRDHYRIGYDLNCQVLTQLQPIASQALGEAEALREQSAALNTAKSLLAAQLAAAQDMARAETSAMMGQAAELAASLERSQRRAGEQYALRELQAQQDQLVNMRQLHDSLTAQAPGKDLGSPAREGEAQSVAAAAATRSEGPDQDRCCLVEALVVQRQPSAALSSGPHSTPLTEEITTPPQLMSKQGSPVCSRMHVGTGASLPSQEVQELPFIS